MASVHNHTFTLLNTPAGVAVWTGMTRSRQTHTDAEYPLHRRTTGKMTRSNDM